MVGISVSMMVNIDVDDLEKAIAFYAQALGLRLARRLFGSVAEMVGGAAPIYLLEKASGTAPAASASHLRDYRRHWTPVHLDFVVDDLLAAVATAQAAGASLEGRVATHGWGHIATLADPFGNGFCLIQFIGRGYDGVVV